MELTAIIVDDEEKARSMLHLLLTEHCPLVKVVAQCSNVPEAVKAITLLNPDVVFLDIDMPGHTGFELLEFVNPVNFEIIFTTAYSGYAMQAFRVSALDYLMKPINIKELVQAVHKAQQKKRPEFYNRQLRLIVESYKSSPVQTIAISTLESIEFIQVDTIAYLQAESAYTHITLTDGRTIMASKNIREFEELLEAHNAFVRIHRSYMVNTAYVARYNKVEGGTVDMKNGQQLPVSKKMKDELIARMVSGG